MRLAASVSCALPALASAHTDGGVSWNAAPSDSLLVLLPLLAGTSLYAAGLARRAAGAGLAQRQAWQAASFSLGIVLLALALVWPLDAWAELSFSAHMAQHMVLIALAPPLLLLGRPGAVWLRGLPHPWRAAAASPRSWPGAATLRRFAGSVAAISVLHGAILWGWHVPAAFELALRHEAVHWLEHLTLLAGGMLFWRVLLRARGATLGWGLGSMLVTVIHSGMLGALITLAPRPLYTVYLERGGVADVLADQQLAGLIMWVPMGTVYMVAALALAARALRGAEPEPGLKATPP